MSVDKDLFGEKLSPASVAPFPFVDLRGIFYVQQFLVTGSAAVAPIYQ